VNPALIRAAAAAYHISEKAIAAALDVAPTVDPAWAVGEGFPDTDDPNKDENRAFLVARALAYAEPGFLTAQVADAARRLGHQPPRLHVWRARWWRARKWSGRVR
jgi:hypothetical protein